MKNPKTQATKLVTVETNVGPVQVTYDPRAFVKITIGWRSIHVPAEKSGPIVEALANAVNGESVYVEGAAFTAFASTPDLKIEFVTGIHLIDTEEQRAYEEKKKVAEQAKKAFEDVTPAPEFI